MDGFRFILENPQPNATNNKQRKRARLVTACDSCRIKKIKCQQSSPNARCGACKTAKIPCLFGDRDRYQAERGVTCTWSSTPVEDSDSPASSPPPNSRKRKMTSPSFESPSVDPSLSDNMSSSSSGQSSRPSTPADGPIYTYRYFEPSSQSQTGPLSLVNAVTAFPPNAVPFHRSRSISPSYDTLPYFDPDRPRFPHPQRMRYLAPLFFDNIGSNFPFLDRFDILRRIEQRTCSAILSNTIAGLAARFADPNHSDLAASATFYDMAKSLAAHVVCVPSVEALHALICITWAEYGSGHELEYSMYSRMAITMCIDLGLGNESTIQVASTPEVRLRLRLTWWAVVCTVDISTALATGQSPVIDHDSFDTALPPVTDAASANLRSNIEFFLLRGQLNRFLEPQDEKQVTHWNISGMPQDLSAQLDFLA